MSRRFLNPYHFVPADETPEGFGAVEDEPSAECYFEHPSDTMGAKLGPRRHDRYCEGTYSGRIVCKLTARTPLIVGGKRSTYGDENKADDYTLIEPYRLAGKFVLPATSLKGMLSTIAEAASFSALRVLNDLYPISYRQAAADALSAMGIIERCEETGKLMVRPIALPNMMHDSNDENEPLKFPEKKETLWREAFSKFASLKVKVRPSAESIKAWSGGSLQDLQKSYKNNEIQLAKKGRWIYGQLPCEDGPDCEGHVHDLHTHGAAFETNRKFDVFLPDPKDAPRNRRLPIKPGVIEAFEALAQDAMENANPTLRYKLPFAPKRFNHDGKRELNVQGMMARAQAKITVYFDVEEDSKGNPIVSKIQFSSIWRDGVEESNAQEKVLKHLNAFFPEDRWPMQAGRPGRITPAEWLFGFVREDQGSATSKRAGYAGRVRVSHGWLDLDASGPVSSQEALLCTAEPNWNQIGPHLSGDKLAEARCRQARIGDHIRLRELSAPKPPSPQLYFRARQEPDRAIAKQKLDDKKHKPQGIKLYLHHHQPEDDASGKTILAAARTKPLIGAKGESEAAKRKVAVKPLKPGSVFWFHLDFDNLTAFELEVLCFALRPSAEFHHKLGMAKPLGLGTVAIEPVAFFQIDRTARYTVESPLSSGRYSAAHGAADAVQNLPEPYAQERGTGAGEDACLTPASLAESYLKRLEETQSGQEVWCALQALGRFPRNPDGDGDPLPVHTPLADEQTHDNETGEQETFRWFVNNETHIRAKESWCDPQFLRPIRDADTIPFLLTSHRFVGRNADQPITVIIPTDCTNYGRLRDSVMRRIAGEVAADVEKDRATRLEPTPAGATATSDHVLAILKPELTETRRVRGTEKRDRVVVLIDIAKDLAAEVRGCVDSDWLKRMIWLNSETFSGDKELAEQLDAVLNVSMQTSPPKEKTHRRAGRDRSRSSPRYRRPRG